jgi:hypothetical protein
MPGPLLTAALALSLELTGPHACPTREAILAEVERRVPAGADAGTLRVRIQRHPGHLQLALLDDAGSPQPRRDLELSGSCEDLARAAAVVIASWLTRLQTVAPSSDPSPELPPEPVTTTPPPPLRSDAALAGTTPARRTSWGYRVGAAGLVQLDGRSAAPGGALELAAAPRRWPVWPALTLVATRPESQSLAGGEVRWMRVRVATGASYQRQLGRVALRVQADVWQAAVLVGGTGFTSSRQAAGYDLGLGAAVTLALPVWRDAGSNLRLAPFATVSASGWLLSQELRVQSASQSLLATLALPRFDVLIRLGAAFEAP